MTAPVPVHPRLGARVAYRLQRVLRPNAGYRWFAARIEGQGPARALFTSVERQTKQNYWQGRDEDLWAHNPGENP